MAGKTASTPICGWSLPAGEADYLIYSATLDLDFTPLARGGLLEDLWTYWENDPDIRG